MWCRLVGLESDWGRRSSSSSSWALLAAVIGIRSLGETDACGRLSIKDDKQPKRRLLEDDERRNEKGQGWVCWIQDKKRKRMKECGSSWSCMQAEQTAFKFRWLNLGTGQILLHAEMCWSLAVLGNPHSLPLLPSLLSSPPHRLRTHPTPTTPLEAIPSAVVVCLHPVTSGYCQLTSPRANNPCEATDNRCRLLGFFRPHPAGICVHSPVWLPTKFFFLPRPTRFYTIRRLLNLSPHGECTEFDSLLLQPHPCRVR